MTERITSQAELAEAQDHVRSLLRMRQAHIIKVTLDLTGARKAIMVSPLSPEEAQQEFADCAVEDGALVTATLPEDQPLMRDWYLRCSIAGRSTVEFRYRGHGLAHLAHEISQPVTTIKLVRESVMDA